jgi:hypothetical protein
MHPGDHQAEPLEHQLVDWLRSFQPDAHLRKLVLDAITSAAGEQGDHAARRSELVDQLRRLQDLYVLGDLTKEQYVMRRQALQDEIERLAPPTDPQLAQAERLLSDFAAFWEAETSPAERHRLLSTLFEQVWQDNGQIVAVKPRAAFARYFQTASQTPKRRSEKCGARAGATGVGPAIVTPQIEIRL